MKNLVAKVTTHTLFYLGDIWSRTFLRFDYFAWTYSVYDVLMVGSFRLNEKYGLDLWYQEAE